MFKLNNKSDLKVFLKLLSEEAVNLSKEMLKEEKYDDAAQKEYMQAFSADKKIYNLKEQDEEASVNKSKDEDQEKSKQEKDSVPNKKIRKDFGASLDSLERSINALRAGKSLKDSAISKELQVYYDRLTEEERKALVLFVRELSNILSGAVEGDEAVDPSDPPLNIKFITGDEAEATQADKAPKTPQQQTKKPETDTEDTSAPIKVNESQDITLIRKKLRNLMRL